MSKAADLKENPENRKLGRISSLFSSIFSRVVLIVALLSIFMLAAFSVIFNSVNEQYLHTIVHQNGSNVASINERSPVSFDA